MSLRQPPPPSRLVRRRLAAMLAAAGIGLAPVVLGSPVFAASPAPSLAATPAPSGAGPSQVTFPVTSKRPIITAAPSLDSQGLDVQPSGSSARASTAVDHVVFLMQENHTFDNYFSAFPGVEEPASVPCQQNWVPYALQTKVPVNVIPAATPTPTPTATPVSTPTPVLSGKSAKPGATKPGATPAPSATATPIAAPTAGPSATPRPTPSGPVIPAGSPTACYNRFHLTAHRTVDLNHSAEAAWHAYDGGKMDGFSAAQAFYNLPENLAMGYYDGSDLPEYYNLASEYVLAQRFFSSAWGSSAINHMYSVAARGGGTLPQQGYDFPTIFDRLQAAGVSWKFYVQNYDPAISFRDQGTDSSKASQLIWDPLANFARFLDDPALSSHIVDLQTYYTDLQAGTLPSVAYLVPSGLSEHPPGDIQVGQSFGITTITSLMRSSSWDSSVFVESWDDWGGWYDHVPPPQVDADGYGFRVPALIVSPYARRGLIDNTTYDFTSVLRFIEDNWGLEPLTARDATANSIAGALDFSRPPADPAFPANTWPGQSGPSEAANRSILLAIYAAVVAVAVICGAYLFRPWQRQWTR